MVYDKTVPQILVGARVYKLADGRPVLVAREFAHEIHNVRAGRRGRFTRDRQFRNERAALDLALGVYVRDVLDQEVVRLHHLHVIAFVTEPFQVGTTTY